MNKQRKCIRYRFDVDFSSLDGTDAFITRLNRTKQGFGSPWTMLVSNGFIRWVIWHTCATKTSENRSCMLRECAKTAHKCGQDVRKLHSWPPGCLWWIFAEKKCTFSLPVFWNTHHARAGGNFWPAHLFLFRLWGLDFFYMPALSLTWIQWQY